MSDDQLYCTVCGGGFWFVFRRKETIEGRGTESDSENLRPSQEKKIILKRAPSRLWPIKGCSMKPEVDILTLIFCAYGSIFVCRKVNAQLIVHRYAHWENTHIVYYTRY